MKVYFSSSLLNIEHFEGPQEMVVAGAVVVIISVVVQFLYL